MEGAGEEERSVFNVVRMNEAEPFKCLTDKRDFQAERERKEFERRGEIEAREYMVQCLTVEEEYILL